MKEKLKEIYYSWKLSLGYLIPAIIRHLPSHTLRKACYRMMGARIAPKVSMFASVDIRQPSLLTIGRGCSIGPRVLLDARKGLEIHDNVTIAYEAIIWTLHHDMNSKDFRGKGAPTVIDDYAWVCSRAIIMPGVKIGRGAVVASGAVVTKDVEPFTVVGGIPARKIGERKEKDLQYMPYSRIHIV
ncbi:MAG: acyltransferase [Prevotella sp.]|nr:acyltransferase [Prevotella sp.]